MVSDADVRAVLEDSLAVARSALGRELSGMSAKHMGWVKGRENLKYGWYVEIQNFDNLSTAKKSSERSVFRRTFRSMYFKDLQTHVLEVVEWRPICVESRATVDFTKQILFGPCELILNAFQTMLCSALLDAESSRQSF